MIFDPRDLAILVLCLLLASCVVCWLMGRREVKVLCDQEPRNGPRPTFVRVQLNTNGTTDGTYLADADTGKPLAFIGCVASQVHGAFRTSDHRAKVAVLLEGVRIHHERENHVREAASP